MRKVVILIIVLICPVINANTSLYDHQLMKTKIKIAEMIARDQAVRIEILTLQKKYGGNFLTAHPELIKYWESIDKENTFELKKILGEWGWPNSKLFGEQYCQNFWLLVQHADKDLAFQKTALNYLDKLAQQDKKELLHYAYLWDRVQVHQQLPQRFGTQGACKKYQYWEPFKIEDEAHLNQRRQFVGLDSFNQYKKMMNKLCF